MNKYIRFLILLIVFFNASFIYSQQKENLDIRVDQIISNQYPEIKAYLVFDEPNFKVKVGDFVSKLDAFVFLQKIKSQYPCSIIKDNVYPIYSDDEELIIETDDEQP